MYVVYAILAIVVAAAVMIARQRKKKTAKSETPEKPVKIIGSTPESIAVTYYVDGKKREGTVKVAQGLQVFRADGSVDLDITENLPKVIATLDIAGNGGSYSNDMLKNANIWWALVLPNMQQNIYVPSEIKTSSGQITWSGSAENGNAHAVDSGVKLVVGVY